MCIRQSRGLSWVVTWAQRSGKEMGKWFGNMELKAMKTITKLLFIVFSFLIFAFVFLIFNSFFFFSLSFLLPFFIFLFYFKWKKKLL